MIARQTLEKNLAKQRLKTRERMIKQKKEIAELEGEDRIQYEMDIISRQISSTKYDLQHISKDNRLIEHKLRVLEDNLKNKKEELRKLKELKVIPSTS